MKQNNGRQNKNNTQNQQFQNTIKKIAKKPAAYSGIKIKIMK